MNYRLVLFVVATMVLGKVSAQFVDSTGRYVNSAQRLLETDGRLIIGGYGEAHYNQELNSDFTNNGMLDIHRMVMLFGYNFNKKTQFVTELEFEHVVELYVEQMFIQHKLNKYINLRAGLMLTPMGIVNEYHEPTTFNGVERPKIDGAVAPTTWREIGFGFTGNILEASLRYQIYVTNGFVSYIDGTAKLKGSNGLRGGRQKGAESFMSSPNLTGKVEYFGIKGLNVGLSGYFGKTQSDLYDSQEKSDDIAQSSADSSVIGINMVGADFRYTVGAFQTRGQLYMASLTNTDQYNLFTEKDLGSGLLGYYIEAAYNVLSFTDSKYELFPFIRFSNYDTHYQVAGETQRNSAYANNVITTGLSWKLNKGAVLKTDLQFVKDGSDGSKYVNTFNAGVGVTF